MTTLSDDRHVVIQMPRNTGAKRNAPLPSLSVLDLERGFSGNTPELSIGGLSDVDDFVRGQLMLDPGSVYARPDGTVLFAPALFDGSIYVFDVNAKPLHMDTIEGSIRASTLYEEVSKPSPPRFPDAGNTPRGETEMKYYRFPCQSLALFGYRGGMATGHIAFCESTGDKREIVIDFFTPSGTLLASGVMDHWTDDHDNNTGVRIGQVEFPYIYGIEYGSVPTAFVARMDIPDELTRILETAF